MLLLTGLVVFCSAGIWQWGRAGEKQLQYDALARGLDQSPLAGLPRDGSLDKLRFSRVRVQGRFAPDRQVLLDNITSEGRPGYHVLTPLATDDGWLMVNRGWVPASGDRNLLPEIAVSAADRVLVGRVDRLPVPGLALQRPPVPAAAPWPRRMLFPAMAEIEAQTGLSLPDFQLLMDPAEPDGYLRNWQPGGMTPQKHQGYAVQWFGLALTAVVIYVALTLKYSGGHR